MDFYKDWLYVKKNNTWNMTNDLIVNVNGGLERAVQMFEKKNGEWVEVWAYHPIESGMIIAFDGLESDVPEGWQFCDGTNGTPDLRDSFIMAGDSCGETGSGHHSHPLSSEDSHTHGTTSSTNHTHSLSSSGGPFNIDDEPFFKRFDEGGSHYHSVSSVNHDHNGTDTILNLPPYYTLAYIMKL